MTFEMVKVAVLQTQMQAIDKSLSEVRGHQDSQTLVRNAQYTEIVTKLAILSENMNNYQTQCSSDRKAYDERILENHIAIEALKNNQANDNGGKSARASMWASGVAVIAAGAAVFAAIYPPMEAWAKHI